MGRLAPELPDGRETRGADGAPDLLTLGAEREGADLDTDGRDVEGADLEIDGLEVEGAGRLSDGRDVVGADRLNEGLDVVGVDRLSDGREVVGADRLIDGLDVEGVARAEGVVLGAAALVEGVAEGERTALDVRVLPRGAASRSEGRLGATAPAPVPLLADGLATRPDGEVRGVARRPDGDVRGAATRPPDARSPGLATSARPVPAAGAATTLGRRVAVRAPTALAASLYPTPESGESRPVAIPRKPPGAYAVLTRPYG